MAQLFRGSSQDLPYPWLFISKLCIVTRSTVKIYYSTVCKMGALTEALDVVWKRAGNLNLEG